MKKNNYSNVKEICGLNEGEIKKEINGLELRFNANIIHENKGRLLLEYKKEKGLLIMISRDSKPLYILFRCDEFYQKSINYKKSRNKFLE